MKYLLAVVSMFVGTSAWATQKECTFKHSQGGQQSELIVKLTPEVKEGTDLAAYVFKGLVGSIDVSIMEVDGHYYVSMKAKNSRVSTQGSEEIAVTFQHGNESLDMTCY
ncbi:hypothetical protein D3C87_1687380 [compost metagenome]